MLQVEFMPQAEGSLVAKLNARAEGGTSSHVKRNSSDIGMLRWQWHSQNLAVRKYVHTILYTKYSVLRKGVVSRFLLPPTTVAVHSSSHFSSTGYWYDVVKITCFPGRRASAPSIHPAVVCFFLKVLLTYRHRRQHEVR